MRSLILKLRRLSDLGSLPLGLPLDLSEPLDGRDTGKAANGGEEDAEEEEVVIQS
jgi:hypothetical protein